MLTRDQKEKFVESASKELKSYKTIGIMPVGNIPDRLLQLSKNRMRSSIKVVMGRKNLLIKILESDSRSKDLVKYIEGTSAIVMSNKDPFELYGEFKSNSLKLAAKPNQKAPSDILISSGETTLQPGQAVTELKQAGIDVQIQKGKVVIAKDKKVKEGEVITTGLSKALHTLGIKPIVASITPAVIFSDGTLFTQKVLSITPEGLSKDIAKALGEAIAISYAANIVNSFTIKSMLLKAYSSAMHLGIEYKLYDKGIVEKLLGAAALQAASLNAGTGNDNA
jgi:large subunit ribosomal protein L10